MDSRARTAQDRESKVMDSKLLRACLLLNPVSGDASISNHNLASEIWSALRAAGIWAETIETQIGESVLELTHRAVAHGNSMVIAAGGDGTVSEVAKGLINTQIPLGIVPLGTYNNMARNLGIPLNIAAACDVLARGRTRRIDVGIANEAHLFFEAAGVGVDAPLFPLGEEIKNAKWWTFKPFWEAAKLLRRFKPVRINFEFDRPVAAAYEQSLRSNAPKRRQQKYQRNRNSELATRAFLVVIANGKHYGSAFTISPHAVLDDGLFHVSVFRRFSKRELLRHFAAIYLGRRRYDPKIDTFRVAELRVSSNSQIPWHIDGRQLGYLPLKLKTLRRALTVIS